MAEFDAQAAEYDQHEAVHFLSSAVVHQLSSFSWLKTSMTILDYGCGTGITSLTLHDHGYAVVGADISSEMLNVFKGKCKDQVVEKYIPMILVEENEWNLPASQFDVVIMAFVLHHMSRENQRQLIMNVVETLQPNGRLCIFEFQDTARSRKAREGHKEGHHQDEHHRHRHHQDEAHVHHGEGRHHHHHHHHTHGEDSEVMQCVLEDAGLQVEITLFEVKLGKGQIMDCYAVVGCLQTVQNTQYRKQMAELFAAAVQDAMKEEWSWLKESISILDFGCGFGMNAVALAQGGHTMTAVDISKPMIESTRLESWKKQVHNDVHVLHTPVGDGSEIPPGEYEMVLIAFVLYHVDIERRRVIIQNVTETVKTGARICIVDFDNTKRSQDARKRIYHTDHPGKKEEGPWNSEWLEKSDMSALLEACNLKVETPKTFAVRHEKDDFVIMDCYYIIATVK